METSQKIEKNNLLKYENISHLMEIIASDFLSASEEISKQNYQIGENYVTSFFQKNNYKINPCGKGCFLCKVENYR